MDKDKQVLKKIKSAISQTDPKAEVILYGSRARGNAHRNSDWDLLILLKSKNISIDLEKAFMDAIYEVEIETGEVISPLIYTKKYWIDKKSYLPLFENIQKEGIHI